MGGRNPMSRDLGDGGSSRQQVAPFSREIPTTIHTEGAKGLLFINGGACASMLAFLGAIYCGGASHVRARSLDRWMDKLCASRASIAWEAFFLSGSPRQKSRFLAQRFLARVATSRMGTRFAQRVLEGEVAEKQGSGRARSTHLASKRLESARRLATPD